MIAKSFKEAIIEMMEEIAKQIPDAINVGVGFQKNAIETHLGLVMDLFDT